MGNFTCTESLNNEYQPRSASYILEPVAFSVQRKIRGEVHKPKNKIFGEEAAVPWAEVVENSFIKTSKKPSV